MKIIKDEKTRKILIGVTVGALLAGLLATLGLSLRMKNNPSNETSTNETVETKSRFYNVSDLETGTFEEDIKVDKNFKITALSGKSVVVEDKKITYYDTTTEEEINFTKRLKTGGGGAIDYRSFHFSIDEYTRVDFYFGSSTIGSARTVNLYENLAEDELITSVTSDETETTGESIVSKKTLYLDSGNYYFVSEENFVFYGLEIIE